MVLKCPGCDSKVADDASICPVCDYIIDTSFLSSEPPPDANDDEESTGAAQDPRTELRNTGSGPRRSAKSGSRPAAPPPEENDDDDATNVRNMEDILRTSQSQRAKGGGGTPARGGAAAAPRRAPAPAPAPEPAAAEPEPWDRANRPPKGGDGAIADPEELIGDIREFLRGLGRADAIAFWGSVTVVVSCFLPWKETAADGDFLGLMSMGFGAFLLALLTTFAIGVRVRGTFQRVLNPMVPWLAQLVMSFLCAIWCLVFVKMASDTTKVPTPIGNSEMMTSSPSIGVYIALLGTLAMLGGTLLSLKERPSS